MVSSNVLRLISPNLDFAKFIFTLQQMLSGSDQSFQHPTSLGHLYLDSVTLVHSHPQADGMFGSIHICRGPVSFGSQLQG